MSEPLINSKNDQNVAPKESIENEPNHEKSNLNPNAEEYSPIQKDNKTELTKNNTFNVLLKPVPLLYMNIEMVGHHLRVKTLLDSRTSVCTICKRFLDKHNLTHKKNQIQQLGGIGHDNNEKVESTIELQLKSHSKIFNLTKFFVVEGENLECDIVIGRQFCLSNSSWLIQNIN